MWVFNVIHMRYKEHQKHFWYEKCHTCDWTDARISYFSKKDYTSFARFICMKVFSTNPKSNTSTVHIYRYLKQFFFLHLSSFFSLVLNTKYGRHFSALFYHKITIFTWAAGNAPKILWTTYVLFCMSFAFNAPGFLRHRL